MRGNRLKIITVAGEPTSTVSTEVEPENLHEVCIECNNNISTNVDTGECEETFTV